MEKEKIDKLDLIRSLGVLRSKIYNIRSNMQDVCGSWDGEDITPYTRDMRNLDRIREMLVLIDDDFVIISQAAADIKEIEEKYKGYPDE